MCDADQTQGSGQLELVLRFIKKAARNLTDAYSIQVTRRGLGEGGGYIHRFFFLLGEGGLG